MIVQTDKPSPIEREVRRMIENWGEEGEIDLLDFFAELTINTSTSCLIGTKPVSFHALRQIPRLENVLKESLRLHPPLIILMRVAKGEFEVEGYAIHEGDLVAASPAISNRIAEDFPEPDSFVPQRYNEPRQEDLVNRWT
jgi:cytochrome P450